MTLKDFDVTRQCVKCGSGGTVAVAYHAASAPACTTAEPLEHQHYTCNTCGYSWTTAPADAVP